MVDVRSARNRCGSFGSALYLVVYWLYLGPLAEISIPKLAMLSSWYEAYYDLVSEGHGGQFVFQVKRLHEARPHSAGRPE
ncbi:Cytochrome P450 [Penicillium taxi]|uniref:Cytochrome P450 n=1 Tax=Penicillium taxi TaxID=168475 RepID=UPI0025456C5F|nr:Cytochrome P450 [Penicillium taxi]KAJ5895452.1 Cytochrome P450 [Penicillium taxi]